VRGAVFVLAVDGRELKVCTACRELALAFLVGQGAAATAVETRRIGASHSAPTSQPTERGSVLLVEDDERVIGALSMVLRRRGYDVVQLRTGLGVLEEAMTRRPDIVLLDLGLPDIDGLTLLRQLRTLSDVPVIITTARGEDDDKILGLDSGADDYLVKPFDIEELLARMRSVMRHRAPRLDEVYDDGALRVDFALGEVRAGGSEVRLSSREFRLLGFLVREAGTARPTAAILAHVWGATLPEATAKRTLAVLVAVLRTKLVEHGLGTDVIVAARGIGYYYRPANRPSPGPKIGYGHAESILNQPPA
jgi:two-component system KDP operon response regulator KdpE